MFDDFSMRGETTPERVLSVIRFVKEEPRNMEIVQKYFELKATLPKVNQREEIRDSLSVAEELGLVELKDKIYTYIGPKEICDNYITFRRFVSKKAFTINTESNFYKATQWYIKLNNSISNFKNASDYASEMAKTGIERMTYQHARGWLMWLRFLGLLYYHVLGSSMFVIPNMYTRLHDCMIEIPINTKLSCNEFISWLLNNLPELNNCITNKILPLSVSNGLRTMEDLGEIDILSVGDAERFKLYPIKGIDQNDFSSIFIKEFKNNELE